MYDNMTCENTCRFCLQDEKRFLCHNQESEHFGEEIEHSEVCDKFQKPQFDMSLEDALKILVYGCSRYIMMVSDNTTKNYRKPFIMLTFDSNEDLLNWIDANVRLTKEYVDKYYHLDQEKE